MRLLALLLALFLASIPAGAQSVGELGPSSTADNGPSQQSSELLQPTSPSTLQNLQGADSVEGGIPQVSGGTNLQSASGQTEFNNFVGPVEAGANQKQTLSDQPSQWMFWLITVAGLLGIAFILPGNSKSPKTPDAS
jgi:hypothetical protein